MENIILIGMPSCGKSTLGVLLAKALGYGYIDCDLMIQSREKCLLRDIIAKEGLEGFNRIEEEVNCDVWADRCVIATGGSAVYSQKAMQHFQSLGKVVYIQLSYEEVAKRLGDLKKRGVSIKEGFTLRDLYNERIPLYEQYADIIVSCDNQTMDDSLQTLLTQIKK